MGAAKSREATESIEATEMHGRDHQKYTTSLKVGDHFQKLGSSRFSDGPMKTNRQAHPLFVFIHVRISMDSSQRKTGWWFQPHWKILVNWDDEIPNWENISVRFQSPPTRKHIETPRRSPDARAEGPHPLALVPRDMHHTHPEHLGSRQQPEAKPKAKHSDTGDTSPALEDLWVYGWMNLVSVEIWNSTTKRKNALYNFRICLALQGVEDGPKMDQTPTRLWHDLHWFP